MDWSDSGRSDSGINIIYMCIDHDIVNTTLHWY